MHRIYISFLGTTNYLPCTYYFPGEDPDDSSIYEVPDVRFVQEATVRYSCSDWDETDRIRIFVTDRARSANWLDDGHKDKDNKAIHQEGLAHRLDRLSLPVSIEAVDIPEGKSMDEVWEIFRILFDRLKTGDRITLDITHAFRSIPLLATAVVQYAKAAREITVDGIYYGAFEVLGSMRHAETIPVERRRAPVFDLKPLDALMDWALAIDRFLGTGDASAACELASEYAGSVKRAKQGPDPVADVIGKVSKRLEEFTRNVSTCRGPKLSPSVMDLKETLLESERMDIYAPMKPLLERVRRRLEEFEGDEVRDGVRVVRWCAEHNLIQQGFTILEEMVITHLVRKIGEDPLDRVQRQLATQSAVISALEFPNEKWSPPASELPEIINTHIENMGPELPKYLQQIMEYRNDLNHAGYRRNAMAASSFHKKLKDLLPKIEAILLSDASGETE